MTILGAAIRVTKGAYVAGFVAVLEDQVVRVAEFHAPKDLSEAGQLSELYHRTCDLIEQCGANQLALCLYDLPHGGATAKAGHRAEGAILAAAGHKGLDVSELWRQRLAKAAGMKNAGKAKMEEAVRLLCDQLGDVPTSSEGQRAAAAARAATLL